MAGAEVARSRRSRRRGLLGRDGIDGVLVLPGTRQVHTVGMRFTIDVAWCDEQGTVVRVATLAPNRLGAWVRRARTVLEAEAGRFDEWGLRVDDRLAWDDDPPEQVRGWGGSGMGWIGVVVGSGGGGRRE